MTILADFASRRERAADTVDALIAALDRAGVDTGGLSRELAAAAGRARAGRFHVLLIGGFSSGKSTLLNALLGEPLLPVKVNPCTAILTEVVSGPEAAITVRFVDGTTREMTPKAFLDEYQLRTPTEEEAGQEVKDRFAAVDRAILAHPLPLLEDGVVLVDTPGLDDDDARTARTMASLPEADAVIFVLNASRFLTDLERRILRRELLPRGLTNLFFPVTMADLLAALADDPERERATLTARGHEALGPLCEVDGQDRFAERFFPLDARGALSARWDRATGRREPDAAALEKTGMPAFERSLQTFLVRERGRAQLGHLLAVVRRAHHDVVRRAEIDRATANASVDELKRRVEALQPRFGELDAIARRVERTVDDFVRRQQELVFQDLRAFLAATEAQLPDAVAGFDLGAVAGLDLLTPRGRERVEAAIREQLEAWLAERVATWQREIRPKLETSLGGLQKELAGDARDFDDVVGDIVGDFAGGLKLPRAEAKEGGPGPAERWFSMALGAVLLSPGTMAAGWSEGYEGALKGAAGRLGARLALLALGAMLGPVGWVGLLLYVVGDAVMLVLTGGSRLQRVREQVADSLRGKLVAQADAMKADVTARVGDGLQPLRDGIVGAARYEAEQLRSQLDRTIADREAAAQSAAAREAAWRALVDASTSAVAELEDVLP